MRDDSTSSNAIVAAWSATLRERGARRALLAADGKPLRTFADIEAESRQIAPFVDACDARSVIAIRLGNDARWPALLLALFRRGAVPLPVGTHVEKSELALALATCGAAALIEARDESLGISSLDSPRAAVDADFLKLTSGTTSAPRAIRFRARQLVADCDQICATMGFGADDLNYGVIPFSHSYGFSNLLTPLLCRGVPLVASEDRLPRAILDGLARSGATVFPGMPVFFEKLAALENAPALPKLRLCISAGAPLPCAVAERFTARFGVKVHTFYGASECGGIGYDATAEAQSVEGFAGTPMRGAEIARRDDGRIEVRSAAVGDGYFPDADEAALSDGRFVPGDLIEWTAHGMRIVGRASDFINVAGRKLNPLEVERCLLGFPGVRQAVVFGVESALRGEEPVACVAGDALDAARVLRFCREHLSEWQVPRDVWIVPEIAANERGKISRRTLGELYCRRRSSG